MSDKLSEAADKLIRRFASLTVEFPDIAPRLKAGLESFESRYLPESGVLVSIQAGACEDDEDDNDIRPRDLASIVASSDSAWTIPKLAKLLSLSSRGLYDLVQSGSLPAYKIGTAIRLCPASTADWLRERLTVPT
jgi:excisionase family DNA binding protein